MSERVCSVPGCGRVHRARGFCGGHYQRWQRGDETDTLLTTPYTPPATCSVEGCERVVRGGGLCSFHHLRQWKGKPLGDPIRRTAAAGERSARDEQGRKKCAECNLWLDVSNFAKQSRSGDGLRGRCRDCNKAVRMRNMYGLSPDQFGALFASQGGACAICGGEAPRGRWCVDHDHACCAGNTTCGACVRGILCDPCNVGLGRFRDDPELLRAAATYLER